MARSARLTNIASGLCGAFISRNNDVGGYWAIGILRLLAMQLEAKYLQSDRHRRPQASRILH